MIEITAGTPASPEEPGSETCALAYVLEGGLEMNCGGMKETLETGDCAYIESSMSVAWSAKGAHCRVLVVRPGEARRPE